MSAVLIIFLLALALAVFIVVKGFIIVKQAEVVIIERLGKFHKVLTSGPNVLIPFFDTPRNVMWRYTIQDPRDPARTVAVPSMTNRVDLRESVMDFPRQSVITRDNVTVQINALLYYQVTDPIKAVYEIQNLPDAIEKLTQTTLRNVVGELDLDGTLTSRDTINDKLRSILDGATDKWGVKVNRVELQDITPPRNVQDQMELQMTAERERRAAVTTAEGEKRSAILVAEGEREAAIAMAQGDAEAKLLRARADSEAIQIVFQAAGSPEASIQYLIATQYINTLGTIGQSDQKTLFLPYESSSLLGALGTMKELWNEK